MSKPRFARYTTRVDKLFLKDSLIGFKVLIRVTSYKGIFIGSALKYWAIVGNYVIYFCFLDGEEFYIFC